MTETKELATLRHYDGIPYIHEEDFIAKYPLQKEIAAGAYGKVYQSGSKYAVKKFLQDDDHLELAVELNMYSSVIHPCILRPIGWTVINSQGYIVMKRGEDLSEATNDKKISMEQIISDTLSAIAFLNSEGIAHGDIKPNNFVYHKGKAKLIDMGLARHAELNSDSNYYMTGIAYTTEYKDPQYSDKQYNNIKCEIAALGLSYYSFLSGRIPKLGKLFDYPRGIWPSHINWFLDQAAMLIEIRPSITELLSTAPDALINRRYTGTVFKEVPTSGNTSASACDPRLQIILRWLVRLSHRFNIKARSLFLTVHLIHRTFSKFLNLYKNQTNPYLQIYGCVVMNLAIAVTNRSGIILTTDFQYMSDALSDTRYEEKFNRVTVDVLKILNGLISTLTYWDYAKSKEDLMPLLIDSINCNYNNKLIREVTIGLNKCISVREFMKPKDIEAFTDMKSGITPVIENAPEVYPCELNVWADVFAIENLFKMGKWSAPDPRITIPIILHNRDALIMLNTPGALAIFTDLYEGVYGDYTRIFTLDIICTFDWRTHGREVIDRQLHPFTKWIRAELGETSESEAEEISLLDSLRAIEEGQEISPLVFH